MRYGVIPTNVPERVALALGVVPVPLLDMFVPLVLSRCLMAAVRLGVFETLAGGWLTPAEVASRAGLDEAAMLPFLRTLVVGGYLRQRGAKFGLTRLSRRHMVKGAERDLTGYAAFNYAQWHILESLEKLLETGHGIEIHQSMQDPAEWAAYQRGMLELSRFEAPWVAKVVPVAAGARRLLDIGGSHGAYGAAICRKHPPLRATVLDLPAAIDHARALAKEAGHDDVVEHRAGNALTDELGSGWDVVLLSNVVHHFGEAQCRQVARRVHAATAAGGAIAIYDAELPDPRTKADFNDGAALYFRLCSDSRTYNGREMEGWLEDAGFASVTSHRSIAAPGSVVVTGIKR